MQAFNNDEHLKTGLLAEVRDHRATDRLIRGTYGDIEDEDFRGCAVGCSIRSYSLLIDKQLDTSDHANYEKFGIPRLLARLEDGIFENLPEKEAMEWPERFLEAIPVGAELSGVWPKFAQWLLTDPDHGVIQYAKIDEQRKAIQRVSDLYGMGEKATREDFEKARAAAADAAYAAADAAYAAADAAYAAAYAAADAAAAAYAAAAAAAADDAAYAAAAAAAADDAAYAAARKKTRIAQADKLVELLKAA